MAEYGNLIKIYNLVKSGTSTVLTANASVSDGHLGTHLFNVSVELPTGNPSAHAIQTLLKEAIVATALANWNIVVDKVMFADFTIMGA